MNLPQLRLRRAVASDLDAILALERATDLAPHWPPSAYAAILAAPMGSSIEGNDPGAPFIPRSLRNEWWKSIAPTKKRAQRPSSLHQVSSL